MEAEAEAEWEWAMQTTAGGGGGGTRLLQHAAPLHSHAMAGNFGSIIQLYVRDGARAHQPLQGSGRQHTITEQPSYMTAWAVGPLRPRRPLCDSDQWSRKGAGGRSHLAGLGCDQGIQPVTECWKGPCKHDLHSRCWSSSR